MAEKENFIHAHPRRHEKARAVDLEKCEIDFINGVVCEYGEKYGVPTPFNRKTVEIVHGIEEGKYPVSFENIRLYDGLFKK